MKGKSGVTIEEPKIVHRSMDFLVLYKPGGYSVHNEEPSIATWLTKELGLSDFHFPLRLDKETSGIMPIVFQGAKVEAIRDSISSKKYQAILRGNLKEMTGVWNFELTDKAEGRREPQGLKNQRVKASTRFKVLNKNQYFTLIECELETGRQHQIRRHAAVAGHAIVGDQRYGDPKYNQMIEERYKTPRLFLHCCRLFFESGDNPIEVQILPDQQFLAMVK